MDPFSSECTCGFMKVFRAENCLLAKLEKWKPSFDKEMVFNVLRTDIKNLSILYLMS